MSLLLVQLRPNNWRA